MRRCDAMRREEKKRGEEREERRIQGTEDSKPVLEDEGPPSHLVSQVVTTRDC